MARKQTTSKILVRNIPFQADRREIRELFRSAAMRGYVYMCVCAFVRAHVRNVCMQVNV